MMVGVTGSSAVTAGSLLVATPELRDPAFAGTVVLVLDSEESGSLGVVLNRPSELPVEEVLRPWAGVVAAPEVLFRGGPVETDGALAVALRDGDDSDAEAALGLRAVVDRLAVLDLETPVELVVGGLAALRIFAGYAGWGAGQLEREIDDGSWYVVAGLARDVFRADTATLRRDVLRRQPGDLALHSTRPQDPAQN